MLDERKPFAILISGRGSNMEALLRATEQPGFAGRCVMVISNNPEAEGLKKAAARNIPTEIVDHRDYSGDRKVFEQAVTGHLQKAAVEAICLAGFMRIFSPWFIERWHGKILNIHPSLLPLYKGVRTHERVLEAGDKEHGCTVHIVDVDIDSGPVLMQAKVAILDEDNEETLAARVLEQEHLLYPRALNKFLRGEFDG